MAKAEMAKGQSGSRSDQSGSHSDQSGSHSDQSGSHSESPARRRDWRKGMSDNVAYALLVYTGLQIFVTIHAIKGSSTGSALPYLSLIVLVAAIIPACRRFERRWEGLSDDAAADPALRPLYRRDQLLLWLLAIGLPFVLTGLFMAIGAAF